MKQTQVASGIVVSQQQQSPNVVLPNNSINSAMIQGNAVTTPALAAGSVTQPALNTAVSQYLLPAGAVVHYAGSAAPSGFLLCDGSVVSQTTFAALFTAIGSNFNTGGEGAGNFRLPDGRGKVSMGAGLDSGRGLSSRTVGQYMGAETHTLAASEIPGHTHNVTTGTESASHTHTGLFHATGQSLPAGGIDYVVTNVGSALGISTETIAHTHSGTTDTGTGGGAAHTIIQPSIVFNYIIKT